MIRRCLHRLAVFAAVIGICAAAPAIAASSASARFDAAIAATKAKMLVDPAATVAIAQQAEALALQLDGRDRLIGTATAQWLQGEAYLRQHDLARAGTVVNRALSAVAQAGPPTKLSGDLLMTRGGIDEEKANVAAALADYQQAHNIFRDIGETRSRALALMFIGLLYYEAKDYPNALKYLDQSRSIYRGDPQILYAVYNISGNALKDMGRVDQAEQQYRKVLAIARAQHDAAQEAGVLSNIARCQLARRQFAAADATIALGNAVARQADPTVRSGLLVLAARSALEQGRLAEADALITRRFAGVDLATTTLEAREGHEAAFTIYKRTGNEPAALAHLEALKRLDDKTATLAASANTALAAARFDFANQELKIATLQRDEAKRTVEFERARARTQLFIFVGLGVVTVVIVSMLGVGLVTIRRSRNEVRAANIDLAATNTALAKALAAKTEFLATTSHEIRTPLNGILGMTQVMLADPAIEPATRDRITVVHGAGVSMRALVDDILDVAKMETGHMTIERAPLDLKATLTDLCRMWQEQAKAKGITFTLDLADCPGQIEGDAARLRQIAFNLLSNALKFTEAGEVKLRAATRPSADGEELLIAVSDSGIGIPADKQELIFESFRQADGGTTRRFGGTGLGLSICRNLARAMGGDVSVESVEGEGATFTLALPLVRLAEPQAEVAPEDDRPVLLIVDRNPIARAMLKAVLAARTSAVHFVATADEAVARIGEGGIDLVLIDDATIKAAAPEDAAQEAALCAVAAAAAAQGTRSALLWAGLDKGVCERLEGFGMGQVLAKPIAGPALADALFAPVDDVITPTALASHAA